MLEQSKPDYVLAFTTDTVNSKGTKDIINMVMLVGIRYKIISE